MSKKDSPTNREREKISLDKKEHFLYEKKKKKNVIVKYLLGVLLIQADSGKSQ